MNVLMDVVDEWGLFRGAFVYSVDSRLISHTFIFLNVPQYIRTILSFVLLSSVCFKVDYGYKASL